MKKFIFKSFLILFFTLTTLISVNYFGDSAKLFSEGYEKRIVSILLSKKNATNILNFDRRLVARELTKGINLSPDILVIGSSRVMLINNSYFDDKYLINNAVTGASLQDLIAIYQMHKLNNILPTNIIIGLDPWIFNINNNQNRWITLRNEYYSFHSIESSNESNDWFKLKELISPSYFQASYKNIFNSSEPISTYEAFNEKNTILSDGSLTYGKEYRESSQEIIDNRAQYFAQDGLYSLEKFDAISVKLFDEFQNFCNEILNNNIKLSIYLIPYHPVVYQKIEEDYEIVAEVENKILELAEKLNIKYKGSYNPKTVGINSSHFYDAMHLNETGIQIIINKSGE